MTHESATTFSAALARIHLSLHGHWPATDNAGVAAARYAAGLDAPIHGPKNVLLE